MNIYQIDEDNSLDNYYLIRISLIHLGLNSVILLLYLKLYMSQY